MLRALINHAAYRIFIATMEPDPPEPAGMLPGGCLLGEAERCDHWRCMKHCEYHKAGKP